MWLEFICTDREAIAMVHVCDVPYILLSNGGSDRRVFSCPTNLLHTIPLVSKYSPNENIKVRL
jgi:hypothetical protein